MHNVANVECGYCWDTKWMLEWNVPERNTTGKNCYSHYLAVFVELQDRSGKPLKYDSLKVRFATSEKMLDLKERMSLTFNNRESMELEHLEDLINRIVTDTKRRHANYEYLQINGKKIR